MLLADTGAEVIKVEDPDSPDYIRHYGPMVGGVSAYYLALNRDKRSLGVNYQVAEGRQLIYELIPTVDVVVEQFRPGVMSRLGLDYDTLKAINPRLIYLSITGYGQHTTMAHAAGHDLNYIATMGLLDINRDENGVPVIPGYQLADVAGGSYMAMNAVTMALYQRERTNKGQYIDLAMAGAVLPFMALPLAAYQATNEIPSPSGHELSGALAQYQVYRCSDERYIALGALEPKFWDAFCDQLARPDWKLRALNMHAHSELKKDLQDFFITKKRDEWISFFAKCDVCISPVNEVNELGENAFLRERESLIDIEVNGIGFKTIAHPLRFNTASSAHFLAARLGEDTASILLSIRKSETEIKELVQNNIVKCA
jgi:hypothetical protein